jgi:hypothetical protein
MRGMLKVVATRGFAAISTRDDELAEVSAWRWRLVVERSESCCVQWLGRDPAWSWLRLYTYGLVMLSEQVISRNNVGGVVQRKALVVGLPREAWGRDQYGLVPATQAMRLAIAEELVLEAEKRAGAEGNDFS